MMVRKGFLEEEWSWELGLAAVRESRKQILPQMVAAALSELWDLTGIE